MRAAIALPRKLLLAIDSEGACEHALHACLWLARELQAEVRFAHAFPPRPLLWGKPEEAPEWVAGVEATTELLGRKLAALAASAPKELQPLEPPSPDRIVVRSAHPAAMLVEEARSSAAELLFLGPHRPRKGLDFGNTSRGVLAKAHCGVWIQPRPARLVKRILVPTDLSEHSLHALDFATALAQRLGAGLTVMHVFEPFALGAGGGYVPGPSYVVDELRREAALSFDRILEELGAQDVRPERVFQVGDAVDSILDLEERFDLVVMGTHGHTGFTAAVLGSVTYAVARASRTPLLAMPFGGRTFQH